MTLKNVAKTFPAVMLTGPRQSGKTTLLKHEFGKTHAYVSLENPDIRFRVKSDPIGFLNSIDQPVILDEIQYVPELLPYIKTSIDAQRIPGRFLLTGSQNFALMEGVTESLAGRTAILTLMPLSLSEIHRVGATSYSVGRFLKNTHNHTWSHTALDAARLILRGCYPELNKNPKVDRTIWCSSYITTYLERDIRNLKQVGDLGQFEIFLRTCATRTGQILDLSSLARDIGVSFTTAKRWLSLLETGYQVLLLYPYYKNIGKRLVKRPKLYFTDTGLTTFLLGIHSETTLLTSPSFGSLFETYVVIDFWKRSLHHGQTPSYYYLRTRDGLEVDLLIETDDKLVPIEIKTTSTVTQEHAASLLKIQNDLGTIITTPHLITNAKDPFALRGSIRHIPFASLQT